VLFDLIFLSIFLGGWLVCAFVPWLVLSVVTRGDAGIGNLPLALGAGVIAAMAVPLLGKDDVTGLWLSFVMAAAAPTILLAVGRYTRGTRRAVAEHRRAAAQTGRKGDQPR
jgi:hypothetical protein